MAPDSGGVKGFICEAVLVESSHSGIPLVRGIIWRAVSAGFHNLVLEDWIKTASELQDNHEVVRVPWEVDEVLELVDIGVHRSLALEIAIGLKGWSLPI
jgi:hypothetical protein